MTVKLLCKNNKYRDFGNHTGFQWVTRKFDNLIPGKYYTFNVDRGRFEIEGTRGYTGESFHIKSINECHSLYHFFHSVEEMRQIKFNKINDSKTSL